MDAYLWSQLPAIVAKHHARSSVLELTLKVPPPLSTGTRVVLAIDTVLPALMSDSLLETVLKARAGYVLPMDACTIHTPDLRIVGVQQSVIEHARPAVRDRSHGIAAPQKDALVPMTASLMRSNERKRKTVDEIMSDRPAKTPRQSFIRF